MRALIPLLLLAACASVPSGVPSQHDAGAWQWWSAGAFTGPQPCAALLCFTFPTGDPAIDHVDYVTQASGPLVGKHAITATYRISGAPNFQAAPSGACPVPPSAHLFFAVRGYGVSGAAAEDVQRWWSNPIFVPLRGGETTITVPLTADQWSDVNGGRPASGFAAALAGAGFVGLTFGGGCAFGHGVNAGAGGATLSLESLTVR